MLGRQQVSVSIVPREEQEGDMAEDEPPFEDADDLVEIMANIHLNNNFLGLAREVGRDDIMMM